MRDKDEQFFILPLTLPLRKREGNAREQTPVRRMAKFVEMMEMFDEVIDSTVTLAYRIYIKKRIANKLLIRRWLLNQEKNREEIFIIIIMRRLLLF